jgi:hypothetical protein
LSNGNIRIGSETAKKLHKYRHKIRLFAANMCSKKKKEIFIQRGGFLGVILSAIAPILISKLLERL